VGEFGSSGSFAALRMTAKKLATTAKATAKAKAKVKAEV
jgi:hypothetical protein